MASNFRASAAAQQAPLAARPRRARLAQTVLSLVTLLCAGCIEIEAGAAPDGYELDDEDGGVADKALATVRYEAEARTAQSGCSIASNNAGYTGSGFVDFGGNGTWIEWNTVNAQLAGQYTLTLRYANGAAAARPATVTVNGAAPAAVQFGATGSWTRWETASVVVSLRKGANTVRVAASTSAGGPNVDHAELTPKDLCPSDPNKTDPGECGCGVPEGSCSARYEAESGSAQSGCSIAANTTGFTGSGFMDFGGSGTWMEWNTVRASSAGTYTLTFRYANGAAAARPATIAVNGTAAGTVQFVPTAGWNTWATASIDVPLRQGQNTVRVTASSSTGGPNLDHVEVVAKGGTGGGNTGGTSGGGGGAGITLPIEVLGPSGTKETVSFNLTNTTGITHLLVTCHSCGYNDHALDSDSSKVKAAVQVNGGPQVALKYYTLKSGGGIAGNTAIRLVSPDDAAYGGIGGGFRTNTMVVPISGLKTGTNTLTFVHVRQAGGSIGFRVVDLNLLRGSSPSATVLPATQFTQDDPARWSTAQAAGTSDSVALQNAINQGKALWYKNDHLYDPDLDQLDGKTGGTRPLDGRIHASCSDCHAANGRDLAYFNFSNRSIVERAYFHGVPRTDGQKIAAYIRSLKLPVAAKARPWNPPYQPGPGLDSRPAYEWAAGAGIDEVLDRDSDMEGYLFPKGTSASAVNAVVDRFGKLNMRELPVAVQMPDWNQWLPRVHPSDAFLSSRSAVTQDEDGNNVGTPFYDYLYQRAVRDPSSRNLGDMTKRLEKWLSRGGTCYSQTVTKGPGWRANNSTVLQAISLGKVISSTISESACSSTRYDRALTRPVEEAKHGLIAWLTVKHWELFHGNNLETRSAQLTQPVCIGSTCVDASEARGWVTDDRVDIGMNVFNRAPHYVGYNSREFQYQHEVVASYETSIWYHLQMVLNAGHRRTGPNHYIYTIDHIEYMQKYSGVSQSFRFWAGMIKERQTQTTGRYGDVENGLQLDSAQPYRYYSDKYGDTRVRSGVGSVLWKRIVDRLLLDLAQDASRGNWTATMQDGALQSSSSTDFSLCTECFKSTSSPHPFPDVALVGRNNARVIPQLRQLGVSETSIGALIDWSKKTWPRGPWEQLRQ